MPFLTFLIYFVSGAFYLALFIACYLRLTPYDDFKLIREGNGAAAITLSGSVLGFVLPLARAIEQSASLADLFLWALITLGLQMATYLVVKRIFPDLVQQIPNDRKGEAFFLATISVAVGLLTAASMVE